MGVTFWQKHPVRIKVNGHYRYHTNLPWAQKGLSAKITEVAIWNEKAQQYVVMEEGK